MIRAVEDKLKRKLNVSDDSHFMGALGAALFALDSLMSGDASSRTTGKEKEIA
jgi:activator of 2-hydroxyglutaryl-CoA dehydratase